MEEDIKGAIERLSKVQNDIWYATLYSQEEQNEDIKLLIKGYKELEKRIIYLTNLLCMSDETYIPKSKVKEVIEELNEEYERKITEDNINHFVYSEQYAIAEEYLKKLMEDK